MDALDDVLYVCIARGCPLCFFCVMRHDVCMIRHVDAPMDENVVLWCMYMEANVDAMQSFWFFIWLDEML